MSPRYKGTRPGKKVLPRLKGGRDRATIHCHPVAKREFTLTARRHGVSVSYLLNYIALTRLELLDVDRIPRP